MRPVTVIVTSNILGNAKITSYPDKQNFAKLYRVPLYRVYVEGRDATNNFVQEDFEAIRFGVHKNYSSHPKIVGLADMQTHILSWDWITTMEEYSWRVYDGFFIHDGPDNPMSGFYGSIGCVEICGANEWSRFNDVIQDLSGANSPEEVSTGGLLTADYEIATRPPLIQL